MKNLYPKTRKCSRFWWLLFCLVIAVCLLSVSSTASSDEKFHEHSLVVLNKGINDEVSNAWTKLVGGLSPPKKTVVILEGGETFDKIPYLGYMLRPHPSSINDKDIVRIDNPESPESIAKLKEIAANPNLNLFVDMNLGLRVSESSWAPRTEWSRKVIQTVAEAHVEIFPDSKTLLIGHSAGTEPIATIPEHAKNSERLLFDNRIAISARRKEGYPPGTICVFKDGDFYFSPGGSISADAIFKTMGEAEASLLAKQGYAVVRIEGEKGPNFAPQNGNPMYLAAYASEYLAEATTQNIANRFSAHTVTTNVEQPNARVLLYAPHSEKPVEMLNASVANGIKAISDVVVSSPTRENGAARPEGELKDAVRQLTEKEPTPGLGGISLNATAQIPIDPRVVAQAGYDSQKQRLYLKLTNGKSLLFPVMDSQVLRLGFRFGYLSDKKPELSIGDTFFDTPDGRRLVNLAPPGRQPIYYFGGTEDTLLGLVMCLADQTLATLTFGSSSAVKPTADQVPGFRSLPELFPEKYTEHPASEGYLGSGARVFMHPSLVEIVRKVGSDDLEFGATEFSVEFGKMGPAEAVFGSFLQSHFDEIANTEQGAVFKQLAAYARVLAVFRWLKENDITFNEQGLSSEPILTTFTPRDAVPITLPSPGEIATKSPTMLFGPAGPIKIIRANGAQTSLTYRNGLPTRVRRGDGSVLEIFRDDLGNPVAIRMNGTEEAGFYVDSRLGQVFAANVHLQGSGRNLKIQVDNNAVLVPEKRPEDTVSLIVARFSLE